MTRIPLAIPEIGLIAGTRAAFGASVALLLADRLDDEQRRAVGWTLPAVGAITTIPIVTEILRSQRVSREGSDQTNTGRMTQERRAREEYAS
jgi:hypothetical protein